ncbi:MAG: esterase/lipase-like protein [Fibrobacteres bacterium]|nr:esterase/lipase-like protein [Fibrobacterota bacterium]
MQALKIPLVLVLFQTLFVSAATPVRYLDNVFTNVTVTSDITYGANSNVDGTPQTLKLDLYQPTGDTAKARPLVLFLFGGGFAVGTKKDGDMVLLSQTYAKKGYVSASIQYRLDLGLLSTKPFIPVQIAAFRGMQDAKAAIRFLRAHKGDYKIDDTRIFIGGCSAGAVISLEVAFLDAKEIPSYIDTNKVGGLEGKSGTPGVSSAINGVFNNWGAVPDSTWLLNNAIPVVSFAGTADPEVPFDHNADYYGSACIHRVLTRQGTYSVLKPFPGMGHGMGTGDKRYDTLLTMSSQFAYDVLFKNRPTTINAFNRASVFPNTVPSGTAMVHALNGRAITDRKNIDIGTVSHKARGIYLVQPVTK